MSVSVLMPQLGESVTEGTVTRWLKKEGEQVTADEPLLEVSTDKVDTEIPAPASGILRGIVVDEDETVAVGAQLAVIEDADAPAATPAPAAPAPAPAAETPAAPAAPPAPSYQPPAPAPAPAAPSYAPLVRAAGAVLPAPGGGPGQRRAVRVGQLVVERAVDARRAVLPAARRRDPAPRRPPAPSYQPPASPRPGRRPARTRRRRPSPRRPWPTPTPSPRRCRPATRRTSRRWCASSPPSTRSRSSRSPAPGSAAGSASRTSSTRPPSAARTRPPRPPLLPRPPPRPRPPRRLPRPAAAPAATPAPARPAIVPDALRGTTQRMSRPRQVIAKRMVESLQTSAQLTTVVEVDVTNIARLRDRAKAAFEAREGVKLTFLPFFAQATVEALKIHPKLNSVINAETQEVTYHAAEHLGIAVDTERGLMVPVIHGAGDLNIGGLARKIADLASRTRGGQVGPDELSGGTFTLTNTGSRGALFDTPIINLPQVGILGVGSVVKRAVVVEDPALGEVIAVRSMVYLALTYDHRLVDGADAARFLVTVKNRLEEGAFEADLGL